MERHRHPALSYNSGLRSVRGKDARTNNILVAKVIGEVVKTTLGPKGSDKMLINQSGDVIITNDGATLLKKIRVVHPIARVMVDVAKTQEAYVGDGTTTAVVLTGELLKRAEDLLDQGIHATNIIKGYKLAERQVKDCLKEHSKNISTNDDELLKQVAVTSLNSKVSADLSPYLTELALRAVKLVMESDVNGQHKVPKKYIKIVKQVGRSMRESKIIDGLVIESDERILKTAGAPRTIKDAKVAIINTTMTFQKTETKAEIEITSTEKIKEFYEEEEKTIQKMAESISYTGTNVIFNYKTIDERLIHYLAKNNILSVKLIPERELELIAKATGGRVVNNLYELNSKDLGEAKTLEVKEVAGKEFIFIEGCKNPKAVTIFLRGGTVDLLEELERSMEDAISVLSDVIEEGKIVPGGGATEMNASRNLKEYAKSITGREQLAIFEYSNALETIPKIIAENAGLDPLNAIIELRVAHQEGKFNHGINLRTGKPMDMFKLQVVEPSKVKRQVIVSATETAIMILRVDDVVDINPISSDRKAT